MARFPWQKMAGVLGTTRHGTIVRGESFAVSGNFHETAVTPLWDRPRHPARLVCFAARAAARANQQLGGVLSAADFEWHRGDFATPALLLSHPCRTFMPTPSARVAHPVAPDACAVHDPTANAG